MLRHTCLLLLTLPLVAQSPFRTTRHAGLPPIHVGDKFASGDLDDDGDIDLIVVNDNSPNQLLLNDGAGRFTDETAGRFVTPPGWNASHSVDLADIDGDGDLDILIGNDDYLPNRVYRNDGLAYFTDVTATALPAQQHFTECQVVADFDGDGDVDWFTVDGGVCHFYDNVGTGSFVDASSTRLIGLPSLAGNRFDVTPFARDIDLDGDLDVMIPRYGATPYLIVNQGGVLGPSSTQLPITVSGRGHWFTDYDRDGDPDVFAGGGQYLLQNQGNGTFVDITAVAFPSTPANALACFDQDDDGWPDLVTNLAIWHNEGDGTFTAQAATTALLWQYNAGVAAADFDGDGDIDLPGQPNFLRQTSAATAPLIGQVYSVAFHARPGTLIGAIGALGLGVLPAGPFGMLELDPVTAASLAVAQVATGPLTLSWQLPNVPGFVGIDLCYQAVQVDPVTGLVRSNRIRDVVQ